VQTASPRQPRLGIDIGRVIIAGSSSHDFYARTGLPPDHVRFCQARTDKRAHCLDLGLTHFVDDHPEVHAAIQGAVERQYFFGPQAQPVPGYGTHTLTWTDVERSLGGETARLGPS
jgi:hypothetical protein